MVKSKSKLKFIDLPIDDPLKRRPDIALANDILEWEPEVSLEKGLRKTLKWFKSVMEYQYEN